MASGTWEATGGRKTGLACCPLTLLVKDHKSWSLESGYPVRPVMGGNVGGNAGISEFVSLVLEPVANEMEDSLEINATRRENTKRQETPYW